MATKTITKSVDINTLEQVEASVFALEKSKEWSEKNIVNHNYPTREQVKKLGVTACDGKCDQCDIEKWCGDNSPAQLEAYLDMHDVIDSQQAQIDRLKTSHDFWNEIKIGALKAQKELLVVFI